MSTKHTPTTFAAALPTRTEIARISKEAERRRAEAQADLLRAAGRGIVRLGAGTARTLSGLARLVRERAGEELRYRQALRELRRLDARTLDDLALGRADLPGIARRHARAAA